MRTEKRHDRLKLEVAEAHPSLINEWIRIKKTSEPK